MVSHSNCAILDDATEKSYRPIVQMVDNFERNHKLGLLFEGKVGTGTLMVCTMRLSEIQERSEVKQFTKSLISYMTSEEFSPEQVLDMEKLEKTFIKVRKKKIGRETGMARTAVCSLPILYEVFQKY